MSTCCDCGSIQLPIPNDGVGISNVTVNGSNQLLVTLTSGTVINAGTITVSASTSGYILYNNTTSETTNVSAAPTQIGTKTYTVAANTLVGDGDELRVNAWLKVTAPTLDGNFSGWIYINGAWFSTSFTSGGKMIWAGGGDLFMKMELTLKRDSNTVGSCDFKSYTYDDKQVLIPWQTYGRMDIGAPGLPAFNFTTNSIIVAVYAQSFDGNGDTIIDNPNVTCEKFTVEYMKKV